MFLARAALSPLATAVDGEGALWWASNPAWLRAVSGSHGLDLRVPTMMPEGTLLALRAGIDGVTIIHRRRFMPTCRPIDERLAEFAVWRGFTRRDERIDRLALRHRLTGIAS